jgi:phospholipase/carboxylesterase
MRHYALFYTQLPLIVLTLLSITIIDNNCSEEKLKMMTARNVFNKGRLTAKPATSPFTADFKTGVQPLNLAERGRDGLLYVPKDYNKNKPAALAVMLHGAGGQAEHGLNLIRHYADEKNIILLAPASRGATWDIIVKDSFDADVIFIDQALTYVLNRYNIDTSHISLGGFSDGASYALSLGLGNGDLFTHLIAFSPGFYFTAENNGKPHVFISHGVKDEVLPITPCSRRIVPQLQRLGYDVNYLEFNGKHQIPNNISASAIKWFLD